MTGECFNDAGFHELYQPLLPSQSQHQIILQSKDGVRFCLHPFVLSSTSEFFKTMLTLPQGPGAVDATDIKLDETSSVLIPMLGVITGKGLPLEDLPDLETVHQVCAAAEKYDMLGVMNSLRVAVFHPSSPVRGEPIQLYHLCHRFKWEKEKGVAMDLTLALDISSPENRKSLFSREGRAELSAVEALLKTHWNRVRALQARPYLVAWTCRMRGNHDDDTCDTNLAWRRKLWKLAILDELRRNPSGDSLFTVTFAAREEFGMIFSTWECPNGDVRCGKVDKEESWRRLKCDIDELLIPYKVDDQYV